MTVRVVLYHNIAETESPFERGLGVTTRPDMFRRHVEHYRRHYNPIDLETLLSGKLPPNPLLITFDDCYRSVLDAARDILSPLGIPSLFFINSSLVGGKRLSLDNIIAWAANTYGTGAVCLAVGLDPAKNETVGALVGNLLEKCTAAQRAELRERLAEAFPNDEPGPAMLSETDLKELSRYRVEIGNHSAGHVHCGALDPSEYEAELVESKRELERLSGTRVRSFSVAYGHERDLPPAVHRTLTDSGHEAIFLVHARSNRVRPAPDIWYRVSFRNEPVRSIPLRLEVLPFVRTLRNKLAA